MGLVHWADVRHFIVLEAYEYFENDFHKTAIALEISEKKLRRLLYYLPVAPIQLEFPF